MDLLEYVNALNIILNILSQIVKYNFNSLFILLSLVLSENKEFIKWIVEIEKKENIETKNIKPPIGTEKHNYINELKETFLDNLLISLQNLYNFLSAGAKITEKNKEEGDNTEENNTEENILVFTNKNVPEKDKESYSNHVNENSPLYALTEAISNTIIKLKDIKKGVCNLNTTFVDSITFKNFILFACYDLEELTAFYEKKKNEMMEEQKIRREQEEKLGVSSKRHKGKELYKKNIKIKKKEIINNNGKEAIKEYGKNELTHEQQEKKKRKIKMNKEEKEKKGKMNEKDKEKEKEGKMNEKDKEKKKEKEKKEKEIEKEIKKEIEKEIEKEKTEEGSQEQKLEKKQEEKNDQEEKERENQNQNQNQNQKQEKEKEKEKKENTEALEEIVKDNIQLIFNENANENQSLRNEKGDTNENIPQKDKVSHFRIEKHHEQKESEKKENFLKTDKINETPTVVIANKITENYSFFFNHLFNDLDLEINNQELFKRMTEVFYPSSIMNRDMKKYESHKHMDENYLMTIRNVNANNIIPSTNKKLYDFCAHLFCDIQTKMYLFENDEDWKNTILLNLTQETNTKEIDESHLLYNYIKLLKEENEKLQKKKQAEIELPPAMNKLKSFKKIDKNAFEDHFRNRKVMSSRAPSKHVDDYEKNVNNTTATNITTNPTEENKENTTSVKTEKTLANAGNQEDESSIINNSDISKQEQIKDEKYSNITGSNSHIKVNISNEGMNFEGTKEQKQKIINSFNDYPIKMPQLNVDNNKINPSCNNQKDGTFDVNTHNSFVTNSASINSGYAYLQNDTVVEVNKKNANDILANYEEVTNPGNDMVGSTGIIKEAYTETPKESSKETTLIGTVDESKKNVKSVDGMECECHKFAVEGWNEFSEDGHKNDLDVCRIVKNPVLLKDPRIKMKFFKILDRHKTIKDIFKKLGVDIK